MTKFEGCYLTNAGLEMVHSTGLGRIIFTRAETGSGAYDSKEDIPEMARLKNQKQAFGLDSLTKGENFTVDVKFTIHNKGLEAGYQLSEIGIYAKVDDGEEKLYCVAFALPGNTEEVPPDDGGSIAYVTAVNIETVVSTDCEVSVIYAADHEWTIEYVEGVAEKINAILVNKVDKEKGKGLSTEDYTTAEKDKLKEIEEKANNYIHPESHPASMIEEDGTHRFVCDDQINNWDETLEEAQKYTDAAYQQSTGYTDKAIADLIGGAPELRNTLKELSDAIDENGDIAEALNAAIGEKADQKVMESLLGQKLDSTGDAKGNTVTFTSSDTEAPSGWMNFGLFKSGDTIKAIMEKISIKARNLRYIWKLLGTTDISKIGNGTVTGAIDSLNNDLANKQPTITGAATTIANSNLTANRALVSNGAGKVSASAVTDTELGYLDGVTSNVQTQLNGKYPTTGGAITGDVSFSGTTRSVKWNVSGASIYSNGEQALIIAASGETDYSLFLGVRNKSWYFGPHKNQMLELGSASYKWLNIYANNGAIQTSDRYLKKNIAPLTDKHIQFFYLLAPVSYQFIDGTSGRTHIGFISQDVEAAMQQVGLTDLDFAGFCKDVKMQMHEEKYFDTETYIDEETGEEKEQEVEKIMWIEEPVLDENGAPVYIYSLRYDEFIGIIAHVVQTQQNKIDSLQRDVEDIKSKLSKISI